VLERGEVPPMPTIKVIGPYRFYFYSHEPNEPPHIHIDRDNLSAKYWLEAVSLARNYGFNARELNTIYGLVVANRIEFLEAWYGHFGSGSR
jgi:hypothetical protein